MLTWSAKGAGRDQYAGRAGREVGEELRHRSYEVFEIPFGRFSDRDAMIQRFYRLGRILLGKEQVGKLRNEPAWFIAELR